ncbi:MAG: hypothetical protein PWP22_1204 [Thermoanaerobacter sp.]|nr:hypothetical protein [Thermoanaerobacter sp.]
MESKAFGFIETYGLVAAIEATDAALKAANVELYAFRYTTGGLVTTIITGDVGAVKAATEAGFAAAKRIGNVVSVNVIPRMDENSVIIIDGRVNVGSEGEVKAKNTERNMALQDLQEEEQIEESIQEEFDRGMEETDSSKTVEKEKIDEISDEIDGNETKKDGENEERENEENPQNDENIKRQEELIKITARIKELITKEHLRKIVEQTKSIDKISAKNLRKIAKELLGKEVLGERIDSMRKAEILDLLIKHFGEEV